jgi:hypothetical protein
LKVSATLLLALLFGRVCVAVELTTRAGFNRLAKAQVAVARVLVLASSVFDARTPVVLAAQLKVVSVGLAVIKALTAVFCAVVRTFWPALKPVIVLVLVILITGLVV